MTASHSDCGALAYEPFKIFFCFGFLVSGKFWDVVVKNVPMKRKTFLSNGPKNRRNTINVVLSPKNSRRKKNNCNPSVFCAQYCGDVWRDVYNSLSWREFGRKPIRMLKDTNRKSSTCSLTICLSRICVSTP